MDSQVQAGWGALHITVTGFALKKADAVRQGEKPTLEVHGSGLRAFVQQGAARAAALASGTWHPRTLSEGRQRVNVKSDFLDALAADARSVGLANVKGPKGTRPSEWHMSIGAANFTVLKDMMLDPQTSYTLWVARRVERVYDPQDKPLEGRVDQFDTVAKARLYP